MRGYHARGFLIALGLIVGLAWVDYTDEADHQRRMARAQRRRHG